MTLLPYDFDVVWMTCGTRGTPHAATLKQFNPSVICHVNVSTETGLDGWRNCDRNIRDWWTENSGKTSASGILFLEWDVHVNCDLRTIFPKVHFGIEGPHMRKGHFSPLAREFDKLPAEMQSSVILMAPTAVLLLSRAALDDVTDPKYDELFASDILSEIRLATVVSTAGFTCVENTGLKQVKCFKKPFFGTGPGVFHPVK